MQPLLLKKIIGRLELQSPSNRNTTIVVPSSGRSSYTNFQGGGPGSGK